MIAECEKVQIPRLQDLAQIPEYIGRLAGLELPGFIVPGSLIEANQDADPIRTCAEVMGDIRCVNITRDDYRV